MAIELYDHQRMALNKCKNGSILSGGTGSGKSITGIAYYYLKVCKGGLCINGKGTIETFKEPKDLYIITTAKKRDSLDWELELNPFCLFKGYNPPFNVKVEIDSWNNIKKYRKVFGSFFIFDEQRVVGKGAWVKSFLDITRKNGWIMLSATPGDTWIDYIPVFIANGFYKNRTEFMREHVITEYLGAGFKRYPKITGYLNEGILLKHRKDILIPMDFERKTVPHHIKVLCDYDKDLYNKIWRDRWDPYDDEPIEETGKLFYLLRKAVNLDDSRTDRVLDIARDHPKLIIFYNFAFEYERLREIFEDAGFSVGAWNGQVHTEVPNTGRWVYLVQYAAGSEGWNCITTDTIIFYSQSYSYRMTKQAEGRIDRLNTPFTDLYYYYFRSNAKIDIAIRMALINKQSFNEGKYLKGEYDD